MKYLLLINLLLLGLTACAPSGPEPLRFGKEACSYCRMTISDKSYGAEALNDKGKTYKFDAAECMLQAASEGNLSSQNVSAFYVVDASHPGTLVVAENAFFLVSENMPSPMGEGITAFGKGEDAQNAQKQYAGTILTWREMKGKFGL